MIRKQEELYDPMRLWDELSDEALVNFEETLPKKSRWAQCSEHIHQNPPLRGIGKYVRQCSKEFREAFAFQHNERKDV